MIHSYYQWVPYVLMLQVRLVILIVDTCNYLDCVYAGSLVLLAEVVLAKGRRGQDVQHFGWNQGGNGALQPQG